MRLQRFMVIVAVLMVLPAAAAEVHQVPFVVGLTTTKTVSEPRGDYETVEVLQDIGREFITLVRSSDAAPNDAGEIEELSISRRVRLQDLHNSRVLRTYFHTSDPQEFPGTSPLVTSVMINELRATGHTHVTYLDVEPQFGMTFVKHTVSGDLIRVEPAPVELTMLVNGSRIALRTLHVKARVTDGDYVREFEEFLLDDAENPMLLRSRGSTSSSAVVKIEFPVPPGAADSMEQQLSKHRKAVVYGIYFAFAHADIRPVSERVLKEIAQVMKKNPDWKLRIDGHTDNIGGDKSNLDLSQRRAAAVKSALVQRYGIAVDRLSTGGYGASQPQEKNDSPEGRARNRRVVLTRE